MKGNKCLFFNKKCPNIDTKGKYQQDRYITHIHKNIPLTIFNFLMSTKIGRNSEHSMIWEFNNNCHIPNMKDGPGKKAHQENFPPQI